MTKSVNQLKIGSLLSYVQMALGIIIGLTYTPIMIRLLGQSEYGLYNTVSSTVSMLSLLSLGFNAGYIRYYAKYKKAGEEEAIYKLNGLFLLIFTIIGLVALACGLFLSYNLHFVFDDGLTDSEYATARILMLLLTVNLAVSFPMSVFASIISAHEKYVFLKLLGMVKTVVGPLVTLPVLLMGYRSIAMVTVTLIISLIVDIFYFIYVKFILKNRFIFHGFEKGLFKSLFIYTSFIAINILVDQLNWDIDKIFLGRFCGTNAVAIYSIGFTIYQYYMTFSTAISNVLVPKIHGIVNDINLDEKERNGILTNLFIKVGTIQLLITGLVLTGFIFFGRYFVTFWAGMEYDTAYFVALLLMIPSTASFIQNTGIEIRRAKNKHKLPALFMLFTAILNAIVSVILIQKYGVIGTSIGTAVARIVNILVINIYYYRVCGINIVKFWSKILILLRSFILPCVIGIIFNYFWAINNFWVFIVQILIYVIVYLLSIFFFGINKIERNKLLGRTRILKVHKE